ncbi:hypothetical protein LGN17_05770 [Burkholderia sp. AU30280]|nr:hypothetical protein [Burkholderia sp. AU30280]MCA8272029.1 hypothetical protein [Burkholderia sp. AU30280]
MQYSLDRILTVTALAWQLTVPAEMEPMVDGSSITDVDKQLSLKDGYEPE